MVLQQRAPHVWLKKLRRPNTSRLERFLGPSLFQQVQSAVTRVYWPIPISIPGGAVYGYQGEFWGHNVLGGADSLVDFYWRALQRAIRKQARGATANMGFASLSDAISEATTGGKLQPALSVAKNGPTGVIGVASSLWRLGAVPLAGTVGAALAGGTTYSSASTGCLGPQADAAGGDTLHLMSAMMTASVAGNCLLLYDRLWAGAPNMNSAAAQTVTYTRPSRYGDTEVKGTFAALFVTGTALAATAHNINGQYTDQDGNTAQAFGQTTGVSSAIVDRYDGPAGTWFWPLAAGDTGIRTITQFTLSAAVATGSAEIIHGMNLAVMPCPFANVMMPYNFFGSVFNPVRIRDGACLGLIELAKASTTATNYTGLVQLVSG